MKLVILVSIGAALFSGCSIQQRPYDFIRELDHAENAVGAECRRLGQVYATTGTSSESARAEMRKVVMENGGNTVVYISVRGYEDAQTGEVVEYRAAGLAYFCDA